jgi:signal recognition particle receptor subunit alpha
LEAVSKRFKARYKDELSAKNFFEADFDSDFQQLRQAAEAKYADQQTATKMRSFEETKRYSTTKSAANAATAASNPIGTSTRTATAEAEEGDEQGGEDDDNDDETEEESSAQVSDADDGARKEAEMKKRLMAKFGAKKGPLSPTVKKIPPISPSGKKAKESRVWPLGSGKLSAKIDFSEGSSQASTDQQIADDVSRLRVHIGRGKGDVHDMLVEEEDEEAAAQAPSGMFSFFKGITGGSVITAEALEPVMDQIREHLIGKNVAAEISQQLCDSLSRSLVGKSKSNFRGIQSIVKESLEEALTRILSPARRIDILRDVMSSKAKGKPHTIVFCGVNGVGKSTNLLKICYWLLENNLTVLIAACDTFRAGAVEQLRTHQRKLEALYPAEGGKKKNVILYEKGYNKDDAAIAGDAIRFGHNEGYDVVLVDTSGRMQDDEKLMRSLAKLIRVNDPSMVLFVGEALVGNEAVDQLTKFNKALADHSESEKPRLIDGIVLTKFDTIDDKVGAAISMTYTTGQPIVFVGTGQSYPDLKKLNVKSVVQALLK